MTRDTYLSEDVYREAARACVEEPGSIFVNWAGLADEAPFRAAITVACAMTLRKAAEDLDDEAQRPRNPPPAVEALRDMAKFFRAEADDIGADA